MKKEKSLPNVRRFHIQYSVDKNWIVLVSDQFVDACKKIDATAVRRALLFFKRNPPSPLDLNVVDTEG